MPLRTLQSISEELQSSMDKSPYKVPALQFRDPFGGSFNSSVDSLVPPSSELASDEDISGSTTPRNDSFIEEEFDFSCTRPAGFWGLSPALDDTSLTPIGGARLARFHRVNHSTIGIASQREGERWQDGGPSLDGRALDSDLLLDGESLQDVESSPRRQRQPRRTQSMFATPEQMLSDLSSNTEGLSMLGSAQCPVPTFNVRNDPFPRMTPETLCRLLDGEFSLIYTEVVVVDCRFEYEFEGGHIDGALNVNTKVQLENALFGHIPSTGRILLVFHCEHSAFRSPMLASHLRHCDRSANASRYPSLFYPDVAVLDGGYSSFYAIASSRCVPQNYIGMNHQEHRLTCERELSKFRSTMKSRKPPGMASAPDLNWFKFPSQDAAAFEL